MTGIIVAPATAPHPGRLAVIRLSGPESHALAGKLAEMKGRARVRSARFKPPFEGLCARAYFFLEGASYTTEEMVELHVPGNPLLVSRIVAQCLRLGAREAARGEFTQRAVRGGRLTLQQALAVMQLVGSVTQDQRREALKTLTGSAQDALSLLRDRVMEGLVRLENDLDFDDLDEGLLPQNFGPELARDLARHWQALSRHKEGSGLPRVALKGPCNAGKSTLFNALGGRALVSAEAGTTRDYIEAEVSWAGQRFVLVDTPGTSGPDTPIDDRAQELAADQWGSADLVVQVGRAGGEDPADWFTCCDLIGETLAERHLSAQTGQGLEAFRDWIVASLALRGPSAYLSAIHQGRIGELIARLNMESSDPVAMATTLRELAQELNPLGEAVHPDEVLGRLFSTFCVGK